MREILSILLSLATLASVVCGCRSQSYYRPEQSNDPIMQVHGFGDEVYVWEGFIFSTNRVMNAK